MSLLITHFFDVLKDQADDYATSKELELYKERLLNDLILEYEALIWLSNGILNYLGSKLRE